MMNRFRPDADCSRAPLTNGDMRQVAEATVLGAVLLLAWQACRSTHRRRRAGRSAPAPAAEHTWEGEGGRPAPSEHAPR